MAIAAAFVLALIASPMQATLVTPQAGSGSRARVEAAPDHARIGEPIVLTIVVEHPDGANIVLPDPASLPRSLAFVQDLGLRRQADPAAPGRRITRARWQVMALESGDLTLPPLQITVEEGAQRSLVEAGLPVLAIEPALAAGEDAPRPAKGFRETPRDRALSLRGVITGAVLAVLVTIAAVVLWRRRANRQPGVKSMPSALERLAAIEQRAKAAPAAHIDPEGARALTFELTRVVRDAVDAHTGVLREALTDADWSLTIAGDERVPEDARRSATRLLAATERVKYAQESPSPLALREWLADARSALEVLGSAQRMAA